MSNPPSLPGPVSLSEAFGYYASDFITSLEWSPSGDRLAVGAADGSLLLLNAADGKLWRTLEGHAQGLDSLSWRPDGGLLASGGQDGRVKFWFLNESQIRCVSAPGGAAWVEHVEWNRPDSADPRYPRLASSSGKKLKLWDFEGNLVREFPEHPKTILDLQWHPNRPLIAAGLFGGVMVWGAKDGELHKKYDLPTAVLKVEWSPNGQWLVAGNQDASVHLWRTRAEGEMHMRGYQTKVRELSWDSTSTFLAVGGAPVVAVWDCSGEGPAGRTPEQLSWHPDLITVLSYAHEGFLLASGSADGNVAVWDDSENPGQPVAVAHLPGEVSQIKWSPDNSLLAVSDSQGGVRVFRT